MWHTPLAWISVLLSGHPRNCKNLLRSLSTLNREPAYKYGVHLIHYSLLLCKMGILFPDWSAKYWKHAPTCEYVTDCNEPEGTVELEDPKEFIESHARNSDAFAKHWTFCSCWGEPLRMLRMKGFFITRSKRVVKSKKHCDNFVYFGANIWLFLFVFDHLWIEGINK